jgi:hypothetical protein
MRLKVQVSVVTTTLTGAAVRVGAADSVVAGDAGIAIVQPDVRGKAVDSVAVVGVHRLPSRSRPSIILLPRLHP